jgi:4-amino-4-deoxy-L-arabinose transferase-like glycosyltransferase
MEKRFSEIYPQTWAQVILLVGFCFFLFFFNLNQWDLWSPDEPRYAQVAREMVDGGDWILMHYNGSLYSDKPPLFFWLIAFSSYLWQGFTSFSVRFPSAFFGTLTVLITFLLGRSLYDSRAGFLSGLILATSFKFAFLSTRANMDTTLTFFRTVSLVCFIQWYHYWKSGGKEKKSIKDTLIYGFYIGMALATLTKGPVGFLLPLFVSLIYLTLQKDWEGIKRMKLLPGMLLFFVIVLSWYLPALSKGGWDYFNETILRHSVGRFAKGTIHIRPFYYYLYTFPVDFLPWTFFLPAAVYYGYSKERIEKRKSFLFLLIWFAVIFLFFSLTKGKRDLYLLPLFPAVSLMVGKLWNDFTSSPVDPFRQKWVLFPLLGLITLTFVTGAAIPWVVSTKFPSFLYYSLPAVLLAVGGSIAMFSLYRFKNYGTIFFLIVGVVAGGFFYTLRTIFPQMNPYQSARFISEQIRSQIQPGGKLATYGFETAPYNYYTEIIPILELGKEEALIHFLRSPERVFCLIKSRDLKKIQMKQGFPLVELTPRNRVGHRQIVLISNR